MQSAAEYAPIVQKGKLAAAASSDWVRRLNREDLPAEDRPGIFLVDEQSSRRLHAQNFHARLVASHKISEYGGFG